MKGLVYRVPSSSFISLAAAPANVPLSSTIPAGSSTNARLPAGIRGWTVRRTCFSSWEFEGRSSGWRITWKYSHLES